MPPSVPQGWTLENNALTRTFQRADFVEALALVQETGRLAETANHHPDIDIRYGTVRFSISTHSAGHKVTAKDFDLAQKINDLREDEIRHTADRLREQFRA
jgi:4a-hydroxytetrahydrobiopterin dehydratase